MWHTTENEEKYEGSQARAELERRGEPECKVAMLLLLAITMLTRGNQRR
mgnify:CR=1 FL=1